jgi:hypothetical protein
MMSFMSLSMSLIHANDRAVIRNPDMDFAAVGVGKRHSGLFYVRRKPAIEFCLRACRAQGLQMLIVESAK